MSWQSILTNSGQFKSVIFPSVLLCSDLAWLCSFFWFLTSRKLVTFSLHFFWLHVRSLLCLTATLSMTKTLALIMIILNNMFIFSEKSLTLFLIQAGAELGQVHYTIGYIWGGVQFFWIFDIFQIIEVVFQWGCLPARLSSCEVVFIWGHLPVRSFSYEVVLLWCCLPVMLSSCDVVLLLFCLFVRLSSCEVVFLWVCLPVLLSSCEVVFQWGRLLVRSSSCEVVLYIYHLLEQIFTCPGGWVGGLRVAV